MLFVRSWLEKYINLDNYSDAEIAEIITMKSSEVEEIKEITDWFDEKILVGKIKNVRQHPSADRLKIFDVFLGANSVQIVSAAENVRENLIVPVAIEGAVLPGLTIIPRPMRGEISEGMCCGKSELMLETEYSDGLWELNEYEGIEEKIGLSICKALPQYFPTQTVFDIKILPDKIGLIANHLGMALEIAGCLQRTDLLKNMALQVVDETFNWKNEILNIVTKKTNELAVTVTDSSRYSDVFCLFELKIQQSFRLPHAAVQHMFFAGKNIISGLADASNYVLFDVGQPNHFFSFEKIKQLAAGNALTWDIQKTTTPTQFNGLGQLKKTVIPVGVDILVQNNNTVLSLPAISGGETTKVDEKEVKVLIEFANFEQEKVARNSFALNYRSDGAKIWCGGVKATQIALGLISLVHILPKGSELDFVFGLLKSSTQANLAEVLDALFEENDQNSVIINYEYISKRLDGRNAEVWKTAINTALNATGKVVNGVYFKNPFFSMISTQEDILHEVSKHVGYNNLQPEFLTFSTETEKNYRFEDVSRLKKLIAGYGFTEIITRPFVSQTDVDAYYGNVFEHNNLLELINPYNSKESLIRPGLLPSVVKTLNTNIQAGFKNIRLFEMNKVYTVGANKLPQEQILLEIGMVEDDPYILSTLLTDILTKTNQNSNTKTIRKELTEAGFSSIYEVDNIEIARITELKNVLKKQIGMPIGKKVFALSLNVNTLLGEVSKTHFFPSYKDESDFPPLKRSYSFNLPAAILWSDISTILHSEKIEQATLTLNPVERFQKENTDVLNVDIKWTSLTKTLANTEVDNWFETVLLKLKEIGVEVR